MGDSDISDSGGSGSEESSNWLKPDPAKTFQDKLDALSERSQAGGRQGQRNTDSDANAEAHPGDWQTGGTGGVSVYAQDNLDMLSGGSMAQVTTQDHTIFAGDILTLEAATKIVLQVGDSSVTIGPGGVVISQCEGAALGSSISVKPGGIETCSTDHSISAWNYSVNVPWAQLSMETGNFSVTSAQKAVMKSGWESYMQTQPNWAVYAINLGFTCEQNADNEQYSSWTSDEKNQQQYQEQMKNVEIFNDIVTALSPMGVQCNLGTMQAYLTKDPMYLADHNAWEVIPEMIDQVSAMLENVLGSWEFGWGSASFELHGPNAELKAGYIRQPNPVNEAIATEAAAEAQATATVRNENNQRATQAGHQAKEAQGTSDAEAKDTAKEEAENKKSRDSQITGIADTVQASLKAVADLTSTLIKANEPLKPSGLGTVNIVTSNGFLLGVTRSIEEKATAAYGQGLVTGLNTVMEAPGAVLSAIANATGIKSMAKELPDASGIYGASSTNIFEFHDKAIMRGSLINSSNTINAAQIEEAGTTIPEMILLGPEGASKAATKASLTPAPATKDSSATDQAGGKQTAAETPAGEKQSAEGTQTPPKTSATDNVPFRGNQSGGVGPGR